MSRGPDLSQASEQASVPSVEDERNRLFSASKGVRRRRLSRDGGRPDRCCAPTYFLTSSRLLSTCCRVAAGFFKKSAESGAFLKPDISFEVGISKRFGKNACSTLKQGLLESEPSPVQSLLERREEPASAMSHSEGTLSKTATDRFVISSKRKRGLAQECPREWLSVLGARRRNADPKNGLLGRLRARFPFLTSGGRV